MGETSLLERSIDEAVLMRAFWAAFDAAAQTQGSTAPNPPVGCAVLDAQGRVLAVAAHAGAGQPHAEAAAIALCREARTVDHIHTLLVTLEPCNHTGSTGPCVAAILATPARRVLIGAADPNPRVAGGGAQALRAAGLEVRFLGGDAAVASRRLLAPFAKQVLSGMPWVTVKRAFDSAGSMIPPRGAKTFAASASLDLAHALRRRADAILTGVDTILADAPLFNVRRLADHKSKRRPLVVMDRDGRLPDGYAQAADARGLDVRVETDLTVALRRLGDEGVLEVLVEGGPRVSTAVLVDALWDETVNIHVGDDGDRIERAYRTGPLAWAERNWEGLDVLRHR
jgi:diaminohydroxyphosphoribosylaminopyrimidine deaminase / 5-amino-6-(5-phosphoribosylamino)uracil reductase